MAGIGVWEDVAPGVRRKIHPPGKALMMMEVHFETGAIGADHTHLMNSLVIAYGERLSFRLRGLKPSSEAERSSQSPAGPTTE